MKRIAIYGRKSVAREKGDSINIQIDKCKEFINSHQIYGREEVIFTVYDRDEGYTGANTYRPDFQRLEAAIKKGKFDVLVCYRLDRVSRSVADFSNILKLLKKHNVSFFSATEPFETDSKIGKAMMDIVMVFAELERATITERVTDNMFALSKTKRWISGKAPLGYKLHRRKIEGIEQTRLVVDENNLTKIQDIFNKYLEFGSVSKLETYLMQNNVKSQNDKWMTNSQLTGILKNPSYVKADARVKAFYENLGSEFYGDVDGECGLMTYAKTKKFTTDEGKQGATRNTPDKWIISVGEHMGIIEADTWLEVQKLLEENKDKFPHHIQKSHTALVSGIIRCKECGRAMTVQYGRKQEDGTQTYFYACKLRRKSKNTLCKNKNAKANIVDEAIIDRLKSRGVNRDEFLTGLKEQADQRKQEVALNPSEFIQQEIDKKTRQIDRLIERVSNTDSESDDIATDFENRIRALKQDRNKLYAELQTFGEKKTNLYQTENLLEFAEKLLDKFEEIDTLSLEEQRELVNFLIKRITWDSKTENLHITFITDDGGGGDGGGNDNDDSEDDNMDESPDDEYETLDASILDVSQMSHNRSTLHGATGNSYRAWRYKPCNKIG